MSPARDLVWRAALAVVWVAQCDKAVPLSEMARWKSPLERGDSSWSPTLAPPALKPKIVTFAGSPPNARMFCWTHFRACTWSSIPKFPRSKAANSSPLLHSHFHLPHYQEFSHWFNPATLLGPEWAEGFRLKVNEPGEDNWVAWANHLKKNCIMQDYLMIAYFDTHTNSN